MDRQTLSIMQACTVVGVSRRTIYNWISAGKVEYMRTAGGSIRIFADTLWREPEPPSRGVTNNGRSELDGPGTLTEGNRAVRSSATRGWKQRLYGFVFPNVAVTLHPDFVP